MSCRGGRRGREVDSRRHKHYILPGPKTTICAHLRARHEGTSMPSDISNDMLFDKRVLDRNLRKGLVTQKDLDNHLKLLVDQADVAAVIEAKVEHHAMSGGATTSMSAAQKRQEEEEID